ncbi:Cof-type HAD-IIB family hydrolase [Carnobacterium divergens]|uniref:Cof-type HAD-IIB family hydrolase n=1 Tax=Carnobacterium divergens TaxID=2748 RepID=UPI0007F347E4|nr:Cof-type HAD-IIB family hydrolase [Carnobacterium divergens]SBO17552.1 conserved hypothetical protein [Carnobacterium divergens]
MIKLVAIDIDGTLLTSDHRLTQNVCEAIQLAKNNGVTIVLCTGRPLVGITPYLEKLGLLDSTTIAITQNGALVQETQSKKVLNHLTLTVDQVKRIYQFSNNQNAQLTFFDESEMYHTALKPSQLVVDDAKLLHTHLTYLDVDKLTPDTLVTKGMFLGDPTEMDTVIQELPASFKDDFYMVRSVPYNFEFLNKQASKGKALQSLAESLQLQVDEVMAIGDAENDRSMLEYAGHAVVMENGTEEMKALATFITKSNDEDGVAYAIHELILKKTGD